MNSTTLLSFCALILVAACGKVPNGAPEIKNTWTASDEFEAREMTLKLQSNLGEVWESDTELDYWLHNFETLSIGEDAVPEKWELLADRLTQIHKSPVDSESYPSNFSQSIDNAIAASGVLK